MSGRDENGQLIHYDCVIIDLPDPHNEVLSKLYSHQFYRLLRGRMNRGGLMVSQSSSPFFTRKTYWCIGETMKKSGFSLHSYHITVPSFGIWGFHIGAVDSVPQKYTIDEQKTRFLNTSVMEAASIFGGDISAVEVPVNSLFDPKLYLLYESELKR